MARFTTKNMDAAQLKTLKKELTTSLKALEDSKKLNGKNVAALAKARDTAAADAKKALDAAQKAYDAAVKAANKAHDAAAKQAGSELTKINVQIDAHKAKLDQVTAALAPAPQAGETTAA